MATAITRIEKDFLLKSLFDYAIPVMHLRNRIEYTLQVEWPPKTEMIFKVTPPVTGLAAGKSMDLRFNFHGQAIMFTVEVITVHGERITTTIPNALYKNLRRSYLRVPGPQDMQIQFTLSGDQYSLDFPGPFEGKVIDISVSGLLFAYPHSPLADVLLPDSLLAVKIDAPKRNINANVKIVRRYKDTKMTYFSCCFLDMVPEDVRFLFEFIYGKSFTDSDAAFLAGQV
jgi:c-di-GMP-binding flagellar brake protein YcgR